MSVGGPGTPEPPLPAELQPDAKPAPPRPPDDGSFWADWQSILGNRLILGGLAVLIVLLLTTLVLVFFGKGDNSTDSSTIEVNTPAKTSTPFPAGTVIGRMRVTASVRTGPDVEYTPAGTAPIGMLLMIVGRSEDNTWLQVVYPPGSGHHGWVDGTLLDVTGNVSLLSIAGPEAGPNVEIPTSSYVNPTYVLPTQEEVPTDESNVPTSTPRPTRTRGPTATPIRVRSATPTPTQGPPATVTPP